MITRCFRSSVTSCALPFQPARFLSEKVSKALCSLSFYTWKEDQGVTNQFTKEFTQETAEKAVDVACKYFGFTKESDRTLVKTIFTYDSLCNWWELDTASCTFGVKVSGARDLLFGELEPKSEWSIVRQVVDSEEVVISLKQSEPEIQPIAAALARAESVLSLSSVSSDQRTVKLLEKGRKG